MLFLQKTVVFCILGEYNSQRFKSSIVKEESTMQFLLSLSIALFAGLMLSRLAKLVKLPAVTAYLVAGILIGPYLLGAFGVKGLGFVSMEDVKSYSILCDVALGFIAFS
ncbi:MAG: hypothetical protein IKU10_01910, partial [Clostridia bacterium]|nr:hypothetical protein [Clostridia bacterium]